MENWYGGKVRDPLREGEKITLKGQEFTIPPFRVRQSIEVAKIRDKLGDVPPNSEIGIGFLVQVAGIAIRQNYLELTDEMLEEELGVNELSAILSAHAEAEKKVGA